ncbi:MAG: anthranilate synthase component I [Chitinivibrionales bacterium]|nr:anthranilate synthase component I [Chitinivibrionales bacterium]
MILPVLADAEKLASRGNIIPLYTTILADTETPVSIWLKLFRDEPYSFLLESVTGNDTVARYSFIGGNPFMTFKVNKGSWEFTGEYNEHGDDRPLEKLREIMAGFKPVAVPGLPRFCGGAVGFFSYDSVRLRENIPDSNPDDSFCDDIFLGFYKDLIVFDNKEHKLLLIANIFTDSNDDFESVYKDAVYRLGKIQDKMAVRLASSHISIEQIDEPESNFERKEYEKAVEQCKEYIRAGDIFQVVLSQRFSLGVKSDPFDLYRILRTVNPSPYMYYLSCGDASIIGASPEMLVRVEDGVVETRPIAGTRPRGKDEHEDDLLAEELKKDPKEIAEHVMLVDLGRNDLGRVCEFGSVKAEDMIHIEKYSHVMHLVTNVSGTLKRECDALDALFSCFPAGTLSGAPKIRAMEIIDELETLRRGIYGGALGYIDFSGNLDSCIIIRTILHKNNTAYIQAGAGIVADSVPWREYDETVNKAMALFTAIRNAREIIGEK